MKINLYRVQDGTYRAHIDTKDKDVLFELTAEGDVKLITHRQVAGMQHSERVATPVDNFAAFLVSIYEESMT